MAIKADQSTSPPVLAFSDSENYTRALHLLQDTLQLKPLALETVPVPFTDFTKISVLSYAQARQRLIPGDPRKTSYFDQLADFFQAEGDTGRLLYFPGTNAAELELVTEQLSAAGIQFVYTPDNTHGSKNYWFVILLFILLLTLTLEKSRKQLYRLLVYLPWLLISVFNDSIIAALLSLACVYASHILARLLPYIRKDQPKPVFTLANTTSVLTSIGPVSLVIILFLVLAPSLILWLLGSMLLAGLMFRFRNQFYKADNFHHYHKIPVFTSILPIRTTKAGGAFYAYLLFTVLILATLFVPSAGTSLPIKPDFSDLDTRQASSLIKLKDTLLKHLFVQNALTEGILGTYDPDQRKYKVHFTEYVNSRPSGITIMQKDYSNSIPDLEAQLAQLDSAAFMPFQTAGHDLAFSPPENDQIKRAKVLDTHTYLVSIIALALFFGHGALSRLLHVHMLSYMEQPD